ncbi:MAG: hypothetical protein K2X02_07850 [Alphaproteobacteria bacterium]|nr:hypothetical protein [Alphaproteobacteria bacterium]
MAEIIDLDFYRKFRIVLPMRPSKLAKTSSLMTTRSYIRPFRRKRRPDSETQQKEK